MSFKAEIDLITATHKSEDLRTWKNPDIAKRKPGKLDNSKYVKHVVLKRTNSIPLVKIFGKRVENFRVLEERKKLRDGLEEQKTNIVTPPPNENPHRAVGGTSFPT